VAGKYSALLKSAFLKTTIFCCHICPKGVFWCLPFGGAAGAGKNSTLLKKSFSKNNRFLLLHLLQGFL
jgi:hypothetical protein